MIRYIWSFILEFVGAIICIISPTPIDTPEDKGDDSDADAGGSGGGGSLDGESAEGGGGGISGDDSPDEEENCGGGGGGNSSSGDGGELSGFSDFSNCNDGDKAGSGFDIALYIIIEFFINS
jgi:hypothetical protein